MARTYVKLPLWDSNLARFGGLSETNFDLRAIEFRDAWRNALDPDDLQTNWMVTDVAKYNSGNIDGYFFIIFHRDTGTNTGPAWGWFIPGRNSSGVAEFEEIVQAAVDQNFFRSHQNGSTFNFDGCPGCFYSPLAGTSDPFDSGHSLSDGTLTGGDLSAPTTSPISNLAVFLPSTPLLGISYQNLTTTYDYSYTVGIADDEKPFIAFYSTLGQELTPKSITIMGNVIVPYRPTDVETHAVLSWELNWTTSVEGSSLNAGLFVLNDTGALLEAQTAYNNVFTISNVPLGDGSYPWDVILLASSDYVKGWIDSDVVRVMGVFNQEAFNLYDNGNFIKLQESFCFPYAPNTVVWPIMPGS